MKQETMANKMAALLGIDTSKVSHSFTEKPRNPRLSPAMEAVQEHEIQTFRAVQGIIYFLQAPELFTPKTCKQCGDGYLVSRRNVGHCSYSCLRKSIKEITGQEWTRGHDFDVIIKEVWDDNEPIWIKNLDRIRAVLDSVPIHDVNSITPVPEVVTYG